MPPTARAQRVNDWDEPVEVVDVVVVKYYEDPDARTGVAEGKPPCRDAGWAVLFVLHALTVIAVAITRGIPEYLVYAEQARENRAAQEAEGDGRGKSGGGSSVVLLAAALAVCAAAGVAALAVFKWALGNPTGMIQFGLRGMVAICFAVALLFLSIPSPVGFIVWGLVGGLMLWFAISVQDRVPFAAANLGCAAEAIKRHQQTVSVALAALLGQLVWVAAWLFCVFGYAARNIRERQEGAPEASAAYATGQDARAAAGWEAPAMSRRSPVPALDDDGAPAFYGLYQGCRTIVYAGDHLGEGSLVDDLAMAVAFPAEAATGDDAPPGMGLAGNVYCACGEDAAFVSPGACDAADFMAAEIRAHALVYVLLLVSVFWGGKVLAGVVHVTSSGTVAAWWFGANAYGAEGAAYAELEQMAESGASRGPGKQKTVPEAKQVADGVGGSGGGAVRGAGGGAVVRAALNRAIGPSFGSICLGALVVAVLSALEQVLRYVRESCCGSGGEGEGGGVCAICLCCVEYLVGCLRDIMEYFNRWAFTYVAVYGDAFVPAGRATNALFKRRGWSSIIADQLCSMALGWASLCIALGAALATLVVATVLQAGGATALLVVCAFLASYLMCACLVAVLDAGVLTVIVCFAEDPRPCAEHHPEHFAALLATWREFYGPELEAGGYDRLW